MNPSIRPAKRINRRRGTALYITVLSAALIVSLLGLTGMAVMRVERRQSTSVNDRQMARSNARSAVELGLRNISNDPDWRTTYINGVESTPVLLAANGAGTVSYILEDSDGSLTDADKNVRLKGVGRVGNAVQVSSAGLSFAGALNCLEVAVCSNGPINFYSSSTNSTNQTIATNSSVTTYSGTIVDSDVEAVGSINGTGYTGATTTPVPARTLPTASVFDYYLANGTRIDINALAKSSGYRVMKDVVLSPANNPFGAANTNAIYIIDCAAGKLKIEYSRIMATLVLINPNSQSKIDNSISWEPPVTNFPALLVQGGSLRLDVQNIPLSEAARGVNFNPPGSPYQGSTDSDQNDTYPNLIKGLVYGSDTLTIGAAAQIEGVLITGGALDVFSGNSLTVTFDPLYLSKPPPGFGSPQLGILPGSWLWDAAP